LEKVVLVSGVRTAIGTFGGSLRDVPPAELGAAVTKDAIRRAGLTPDDIEEVIFGSIGQIGEDAYAARTIALKAGLPIESTAMSVNRLCASGLQAVISGAMSIQTGMAKTVIAGGVENMSRFPFLDFSRRWGHKFGDLQIQDALNKVLSDPFEKYPMGETAEKLNERYGISREEQDEFALKSQTKALEAIRQGKFKAQIVPVEVPKGKGNMEKFDTDEHPRSTTLEKLLSLNPVFRKNGSVTAGNSSGINDAASAVVLMGESEAKRRGIKPQLSIKAVAVTGVEPSVMGVGPISAVRKALQLAGLTIDDIDLVESNEAFAVQCIAVAKDLGIRSDRLNVNGGAIALGHPVGATGNILVVKLMHEMQSKDARYGLVTLCIGGGQGYAVIFEKE
jgi:acetyl-CoA C-acetyltransferase